MKKLLVSLLVAGFVFGVSAQDDPAKTQTKEQDLEQIRAQVQEKIDAEVANMPEQLRTKVQAAVKKAEQARLQIQDMIKKGKTAEEIEAAKVTAQKKAEEQLNAAVQNMKGVTEQVRGQVESVKEQIKAQLEIKTAELKKLQDQVQEKKATGGNN